MTEIDWLLEAYHYELPPERIAQNPAVPRDSSRLLVVNSTTGHQHCRFRDLPEFLKPGDLLVLNNTQVIPARLWGRKPSGAPIEVLLVEEREHQGWLALVRPGKRVKLGGTIEFEPLEGWESKVDGARYPVPNPLTASVVARDPATGGRVLKFNLPPEVALLSVLPAYGHVPLPPYIEASQASPEQYQTIYAQNAGAIAAPTAGLHFTDELFERLEQRGIERTFITLHVGVGTFRPVEVEDITAHPMHGEWVEIPATTVEKIRQTQAQGGRIIAVGTTVVRALEGAVAQQGLPLQAFCGQTNLFIYPGYQWQVVEGLITNFHLPRSTLLMLVSALIGRLRLLELYQEAIDQGYRFYSFGDAMLILPEATHSG